MKHNPIHENLDTSFINLPALVRYLRRRQFVGKVRVELSGYEADIYLGKGNQIKAREFDRIAGRISEGEEALQRILIRSREPGGTVNVYQEVAEVSPKIAGENLPKTQPIRNIKAAPAAVQPTNGKLKNPINPDISAAKPTITIPDFPFELTNNVENKARQTSLSPKDWQTLLNLTGELLGTIHRTLASANLDFTAALQKARAQVSADYPFLNPDSNIFEYKNGKVTMREQTSAKLFVGSVMEILQRILDKLGAHPKFAATYRLTTQKILALIHHRKPHYDKFLITKRLEKVLGV